MDDINVLDRIKELCKDRKWSYYKLAQESNIQYNTLYNMLSRTTMPTIPTLQKICDGFGITVAQFFVGEEAYYLTEEEKGILRSFRRLDEYKRKLAAAYLNGLSEQ